VRQRQIGQLQCRSSLNALILFYFFQYLELQFHADTGYGREEIEDKSEAAECVCTGRPPELCQMAHTRRSPQRMRMQILTRFALGCGLGGFGNVHCADFDHYTAGGVIAETVCWRSATLQLRRLRRQVVPSAQIRNAPLDRQQCRHDRDRRGPSSALKPELTRLQIGIRSEPCLPIRLRVFRQFLDIAQSSSVAGFCSRLKSMQRAKKHTDSRTPVRSFPSKQRAKRKHCVKGSS
jgi:hypothetical protein